MKFRSLLLLLSVICFLIPVKIHSQDIYQQNQLRIDAEGTVYVPADLVILRVTITRSGEDPEEAFNTHKEQEAFLTNLLIEESIKDTNITANPITISDIRRGNQEVRYQTSQSVLIQLNDIDQFEAIQLKLIQNGFVNFSGSFSSTNTGQAKNDALKRAVENAREAASLLAESIGSEVKKITFINYGSRGDFRARATELQASYDLAGGSLLQFERTIPVTERVTVYFSFE